MSEEFWTLMLNLLMFFYWVPMLSVYILIALLPMCLLEEGERDRR